MDDNDHGSASVPVPAGSGRLIGANRVWWDSQADAYQAEHGAFLAGGADGRAAGGALVWGPEGLTEEHAGLLGDVRGLDLLEVGAGGAQGSGWAASHGARVVALDLSVGMLRHAPAPLPRVQADAGRLPFAAAAFDGAFSAYGAMPFVPDAGVVLAEVARVVRPGGRWVFSTTHPIRWAFPDDPGPDGLVATLSYFSRTPYLEHDRHGVSYAEFHRTLGDWVRLIRAAGLRLDDLVEPEWPDGLDETWGGWSRLRGERLPGTAIFVCTSPG